MSSFPVTALILAAGRSARLGRNKQLLELDGEPLVRRAVRQTQAAGVDVVLVVTGFERELVEAAVGDQACRLVHNPGWEAGMGSSLGAGAAAAFAGEVKSAALLIILPDQIKVDAAHLAALIARGRADAATIVATGYRGTVGAPALFKAVHASELQALSPEAGARSLLERHAATLAVLVNEPAGLDIDTPEQLRALQASLPLL